MKLRSLIIVICVVIGCESNAKTQSGNQRERADQGTRFFATQGKLRSVQMTQTQLFEIAQMGHCHSSKDRLANSIVAATLMTAGPAQLDCALRLAECEDVEVRKTALLLAANYLPSIPEAGRNSLKSVANSDAAMRAAIILSETRLDELAIGAVDISELVRSAAARRIGFLVATRNTDELSAKGVLTRLMIDDDVLVRTNAVLACREFSPAAIVDLRPILEGLMLDTREEVQIEDLLATDNDDSLVEMYFPSEYHGHRWLLSRFANVLVQRAPNTAPPVGYEPYIDLTGPTTIGWRALTVIKVLGADDSKGFIDRMRKGFDPLSQRPRVLE
ncbi:hypothetical protein [Schlesneria sp. T3-172]|uniref:hypothetical protein n=1 Tax=Schlesneria sphaerica TaxID=3373610 RepID=UPI0037C9E630